MLHYVLKIDH